MGRSHKTENVVLLFENYFQESKKLHTSFKLSGKSYQAVVIEDDGFLPDDVESVYGYFLGDFSKSECVPGKPRYFNQINVPEYWEISGNNNGGQIHELNKERGRIFYTTPLHKRLVKTVDWYNDEGAVRSSDHYNKYGALYARTIFDSKGHRINKSYFDANGAEVIVENYVTKDIILNDGDIVRVFRSKTEFVCFYLENKGYTHYSLFYNTLATPFFVSQELSKLDSNAPKTDVLFWQEKARADIPGNMQIIFNGQNTRTKSVQVLDRNAYNKLISLGVNTDIVKCLGYVYDFKKKNGHKAEALICTNSDRIARCEELIREIPEMHFNIVAITEMSSKLMNLENYSNVTLYPVVKMKVLESLFKKCDYYLDINHESEIVSAVENAFMHNQLIMAFNETIHNRNYIAKEHIYNISDYMSMVDDLKELLKDKELLDNHIEMQHSFAGVEKTKVYKEL